ncbi:MAG: sugar phosphate isomerase/epimerase [Clostridia bacterium]|nr:sugar phosphate isomerase/epimerase [Clostridia bacterium]
MLYGVFFGQLYFAKSKGELKTLAEGFERIVPKGISYVDIDSSLFDKIDIEEYLALLKGYNLKTQSLFSLFDFNFDDKSALASFKEDAKRQLEMCAKIGTSMFMPVPVVSKVNSPNERTDARNALIDYLGYTVEKSQEYGVTTMIENYSNNSCPFSYIDDIKYILAQVPDLKYALDTGNFYFCDDDAFDAYSLFREKTVHVHLKDIAPSSGGALTINGKCCNSLPIGDGDVKIKETLLALQKDGYTGGLTIEINDENDSVPKIEKSVDYIKSILEN